MYRSSCLERSSIQFPFHSVDQRLLRRLVEDIGDDPIDHNPIMIEASKELLVVVHPSHRLKRPSPPPQAEERHTTAIPPSNPSNMCCVVKQQASHTRCDTMPPCRCPNPYHCQPVCNTSGRNRWSHPALRRTGLGQCDM